MGIRKFDVLQVRESVSQTPAGVAQLLIEAEASILDNDPERFTAHFRAARLLAFDLAAAEVGPRSLIDLVRGEMAITARRVAR
jgi:hypothetical protein